MGAFAWVGSLGGRPRNLKYPAAERHTYHDPLSIVRYELFSTKEEMSDFKLGVYLIVQAFAESSEHLKDWSRKKGEKARRRVLGFEELDTSLYNGQKEVDARLKSLSLKHGFTFDEGDSKHFVDPCLVGNILMGVQRAIRRTYNTNSNRFPERCH